MFKTNTKKSKIILTAISLVVLVGLVSGFLWMKRSSSIVKTEAANNIVIAQAKTQISAASIINKASVYSKGNATKRWWALPDLDDMTGGEYILFLDNIRASNKNDHIIVSNKKIYRSDHSPDSNLPFNWENRFDYTNTVKRIIGSTNIVNASYHLCENFDGSIEIYYTDASSIFGRFATHAIMPSTDVLGNNISANDIKWFSGSYGRYSGGQMLITYSDNSGNLHFYEAHDTTGAITFNDRNTVYKPFPAALLAGTEIMSTALHYPALVIVLKDPTNHKSYIAIDSSFGWAAAQNDWNPMPFVTQDGYTADLNHDDPIITRGYAMKGADGGSGSPSRQLTITQGSDYKVHLYSDTTNVTDGPICKAYLGNEWSDVEYMFAFESSCNPDDPQPPVCGDGVVNQETETCDDGNNIDGDGCSAICQIELAPAANIYNYTDNYNYTNGISVFTYADNGGGVISGNAAVAKSALGEMKYYLEIANQGSVAKTTNIKFTIPKGFIFDPVTAGITCTSGVAPCGNPTPGGTWNGPKQINWDNVTVPAGVSTISFKLKT